LRNRVENEYFNWLSEFVCKERFPRHVSFSKLLTRLHDIPFKYTIPRDQNRAEDGKDLRYRFALTHEYLGSSESIVDILSGPCSVLEMMVALTIRCEEQIMDDPSIGNRTGQWFWNMIVNLGLGSMVDDRYDERHVDKVIDIFLNREYEPDGKGGLFRIKNCEYDLRDVEIWYQLCWYLDSIA